MLELKPRPVGASQARVAHVAFENSQPRRLLLALVLLLVALAGVVLKDRQFWFGNEQNLLDDDASTAAAAKDVTNNVAKAQPAAVNQAAVHQAKSVPAHAAKKQLATAQASTPPQPAAAPAVQRTVLPPLDVEVIAGDAHHRVHPGSNSAKLQITNQDSSTFAAPTNAAEREPVADVPQASYPLLAQHMNVQGSVVLQAVIGPDGIIQTLHVVSGPAILSTAAQQAVREWRFKPVMQNGAPVETKARITVNFTIKVGENSGTTLAQSRTEDIQILSR